MRSRIRTLALIAVSTACLLAVGPALGAGKSKVSIGDYQASPVLTSEEQFTVGAFSVVRSKGKRRIVRSKKFLGIYYPDSNECDDFDLPLAAERIPVSAKGRFRIRERTPVEDTAVRVTWKGHWTKPGVVVGSVEIKYDGCTSKRRWTGGKVG